MANSDDALPGRLASKLCQNAEVKNEERGEVRAVIATTNVKDADGDLIVPGAFGEQDVLVSAYGHATWRGELPVGRGKVYERGDEAIADLQFFMDDDEAARHFRLIKNVGAAQEFSFGFDILEKADPDEDQRRKGVRRVIKKFKVYEVSPVFRGAGVNTRVVSAKRTELEQEAAMLAAVKGSIDQLIAIDETLSRVELLQERRKARSALARLPSGALRAAGGDISRIYSRTGAPPWQDVPNLGVVVTPGGKTYERNVRNKGPEWRHIR